MWPTFLIWIGILWSLLRHQTQARPVRCTGCPTLNSTHGLLDHPCQPTSDRHNIIPHRHQSSYLFIRPSEAVTQLEHAKNRAVRNLATFEDMQLVTKRDDASLPGFEIPDNIHEQNLLQRLQQSIQLLKYYGYGFFALCRCQCFLSDQFLRPDHHATMSSFVNSDLTNLMCTLKIFEEELADSETSSPGVYPWVAELMELCPLTRSGDGFTVDGADRLYYVLHRDFIHQFVPFVKQILKELKLVWP